MISVQTEIEWHPIACIFPVLANDKLQELADDIRENGLLEPIVLLDGKILDGRNRWLACRLAQVSPETRDFRGTNAEALSFAWSTNAARRHLTSSQAAAALADREVLDAEYAAAVEETRKAAKKKQQSGKADPTHKNGEASRHANETDDKLAKAAGTNRNALAQSRKLRNEAPDLHEKVKNGEITVGQATTELKRQKKRKELSEKAEAAKAEFGDQPNWTLINQDVSEGLKSVAEHHGPARLIFADPPYNIGVQYGDHHDDKMLDHEFVDWCLEWTQLCVDCLTDDGSLWLMINDEYAADFVANARDCQLHMRAWIKWYETFGVNCSNNFNRTSRHILYFVMDDDSFVFNETEVLRPSDRQAKYKDKRAQSSGKIMDDVWEIPRLTGTSKERLPDFPTQLPLELVSRIVRVASEPGDLIVDPFNGSGTTGVAAIRADRKYVGIDASEKFIDLAEMRLRGAK